MARRWTLMAHSQFLRSLRAVSSQGGDVYTLSQVIWNTLEEIDDPAIGATAIMEVEGRYERNILGYELTYEVRPSDGVIRLLLSDHTSNRRELASHREIC